MLENTNMPSAKAAISAAATVAATAMVVRSVAKDLIPREIQVYLLHQIRYLFSAFSNQLTLVVDEFDGLNPNHLFRASELYLGTIMTPSTTIFRVSKPEKERQIAVSMQRNHELNDTFNGFKIKWRMITKQVPSKYIPNSSQDPYNPKRRTELNYFELSFHKKHKNVVLEQYLTHIIEESKKAIDEIKTLKIFTLSRDRMRGGGRGSPWQSVNLDHPSTFDTLAIETDVKSTIMRDLERFVRRREHYRKVGKAWKRGYLLFGPPGTGKSSLIAAMANHLKFDVYDLELSEIRSNSQLRKLLVSTANRSILVVEDIDCSIEFHNRLTRPAARPGNRFQQDQEAGVTLSGFLNFIDGLWSSCGDERIIVFTTNHKDRLDPALLRPGRMDVHIHMSYCTPCGFKMLASNFLGVTEHALCSEIEGLIEKIKVTPAEVGEQLMKDDEADVALRGLIEFLHEKKKKSEETGDSEVEVGASGEKVM